MSACRPDYQKLHVLRQQFPRVPIMALSATCPPRVLEDIIKTLDMKAVVDGNSQFIPAVTSVLSHLLTVP